MFHLSSALENRHQTCVFSIVTSLQAGFLRNCDSIPSRSKRLLFPTALKPAPGPTLPPTEWALGALSQGLRMAIGLHLVPRDYNFPVHLHGIVFN